jgi:SAM-dependent methyltransferase
MTDIPYAASSARNCGPILGVLKYEFADRHAVLEIGSGTAQHAVAFAEAMPWITWQTSDLATTHEGIRAQCEQAGLANVYAPILLDMNTAPVGEPVFDAVYSSNTLHIMNRAAGERMLPFVSSVLKPAGRFCYYGPFKRNGRCTTASNEAFDQSLQSRNAGMGIRHLERVDSLAASCGLSQERRYAMPANNLLVVWRRDKD